MADYIRKLKSGSQAKIWGDGTKTRDYVFITDVVTANLLASQIPATTEGSIFNIGTGRETSLKEIYEKIARLLDRDNSPIYLPDRQGELYKTCLDYSKTQRILGWEPKVSLDSGLRICVTSALEN